MTTTALLMAVLIGAAAEASGKAALEPDPLLEALSRAHREKLEAESEQE